MNMNITANQPASPMPYALCPMPMPHLRVLCPLLNRMRKLHAFSYVSLMKSTYFVFSGPEQFFHIFQRRASHPLPLREPRFFNADSIDVDASIDRGAQKWSKICTRFPILFCKNSLPCSPASSSGSSTVAILPSSPRLLTPLSFFYIISFFFPLFLLIFFFLLLFLFGTSLKTR